MLIVKTQDKENRNRKMHICNLFRFFLEKQSSESNLYIAATLVEWLLGRNYTKNLDKILRILGAVKFKTPRKINEH